MTLHAPVHASTSPSATDARATPTKPQPAKASTLAKVMAYGPLPAEHGKLTRIPLTRLAIFCETETLFIEKTKDGYIFKSVPHPAGTRGYQRHPGRRKVWIKKRALAFDSERFKALDVVLRDDGYYYVVDGGGRALMAMLLLIHDIYAKVHTTVVDVEGEASLFRDFANEVVRLGSVDDFRAAYAEGNPKAIDMLDSMYPHYGIGPGKENISSVGAVACLHDIKWGGGSKRLNKTCMLVRNTVGPDKKKKRPGVAVPGNYLLTVGAFLEVAAELGGYDEAKLRRTLEKLPPEELAKQAMAVTGAKPKTNDRPYSWLQVLSHQYSKNLKGYKKFTNRDVLGSTLLEAFSKKQYSGYQHEKLNGTR